MFTSRISGTARELGYEVRTARAPQGLLELARQRRPTCVILDLANPGLNIVEVVRELRAGEAPPYVVAYGSHVDTATLQAARDAGCDVVLPRSRFVNELATAMPSWFGAR